MEPTMMTGITMIVTQHKMEGLSNNSNSKDTRIYMICNLATSTSEVSKRNFH